MRGEREREREREREGERVVQVNVYCLLQGRKGDGGGGGIVYARDESVRVSEHLSNKEEFCTGTQHQ